MKAINDKISRIVLAIIVVFAGMMLTSFSNGYCQHSKSMDKQDSMLEVLEALEDGRLYVKPESWTVHEYDFLEIECDFLNNNSWAHDFDFEFNFPGFEINEDILEKLEERMEEKIEKIKL
jgi:hypothetical protein